MHILFYRYGSICEPDVIEAFQELGHTVEEICEEITNKTLTPQESIRIVNAHLQTKPADCIFSINFFPFLAEVCNIYHIRYLSWIVDSPVMELYSTSISQPWNRVFLFDYALYQEFVQLNPNCIFHLPLAANIKSKHAVIASATSTDKQRFTCEISFVGSLYTEKCPYDKLQGASPFLTGYLDGIMNAQMQVYGYYFIEELLKDSMVEEFKAHMPGFFQYPAESYLTDKVTMSQLYIGNKITALERLATMRVLSENFNTTIFTGSDTSTLPKLINKGLAKSLTEMPIIFNNSKINLNTTSKPIRSGLPQRIWDIMGSGGFVLSNYQSEIPELFKIGEHLDVYGSLEELKEKCEFYLTHENERHEIAMTGFEEVKQNHTFVIRLEQLIKLAFT